jgi:hypothetical protein
LAFYLGQKDYRDPMIISGWSLFFGGLWLRAHPVLLLHNIVQTSAVQSHPTFKHSTGKEPPGLPLDDAQAKCATTRDIQGGLAQLSTVTVVNPAWQNAALIWHLS